MHALSVRRAASLEFVPADPEVDEHIEVPECRDPFDRPFLELALVAEADALLTGDKDLLELAGDFPVPILAPAAFR